MKNIQELFSGSVSLAPMEEVSDISYRILCKEMGADIVYTEFINSDGLIRGKGEEKMQFLESERPIGIQIYGNKTESMLSSAIIAEKYQPDLIDINAGCWVKKVAHRGAGAGLLKDPLFMQSMIGEVVKSVKLPVTVKTRLGWDENSINIIEVAKRLEDIGVAALTIHCRTRSQGHSGVVDWNWVNKIKEHVSIPIVLNGSIITALDAQRAFNETNTDGIMVARGAIGMPWVFREIKEILTYGKILTPVTLSERVEICLKHLKSFIDFRGSRVGIFAFRKYYGGYLKGFPEIVKLRSKLMKQVEYHSIEALMLDYVEEFSIPIRKTI